jgi:hypothetical protein
LEKSAGQISRWSLGRSSSILIERAGQPPASRPPFVQLNQTYVYRVQAYQTGGFISNFSKPAQVFSGNSVLSPANFRLVAGDTKVRPFFVMLNWETDSFSGIVDRWEIQRVEMNNFAASHLDTQSGTGLTELEWHDFRTVYSESSRFRSITADDDSVPIPQGMSSKPSHDLASLTSFQRSSETVSVSRPIALTRGRGTIVGANHFMDLSITFGNTYFYRIRAVSPNGDVSGYSYRGIKITDETFENRLATSLSQGEIASLASQAIPLRLVESESNENSFSLVPSFSVPTDGVN